MKNYVCIIITHGDLAAELNRVVQKFLPLNIPVVTYSNQEQSIEYIVADVDKRITEIEPVKIIVFVDIIGGSCWHAAMEIKKNRANCAVFAGINIPGLVSLAMNIERLEWTELLQKIENDAKKAIKIVL
jgi:mannose/fructose-specific phosphotransferase system component IIA